MTLVISRQVSEFTSDTIQTTSENTALPKKDSFSIIFAILQSSRAHSQLLL
jgi:hypothetical protein